MNKTLAKKFQKLLYYGGIILLVCLVFFCLNYLKITKIIIKIVKAILPVIIAVFISFLLEPIITKLINYKVKRFIAVLIVYLIFFSLIIGLILLIVPLIIKNGKLFLDKLPDILLELEKLFNHLIKINIHFDFNKILPSINNSNVKKIFKIASKTFDIGFDISIVIVGSLFLSFDYPNFKKGIKNLLPKKHKEKIINYFNEFLPFIYKYIKGLLLDSLFISFMGFLIFFIFGFKDALFFSLLLGLTNCIPLFGPYISGIPIVLISFLISTKFGITALIIIICLQLIDGNIVQPIIMKNVIYLHPLENILGISILTTLFGLIGMIISPIVVTSIKILIKQQKASKDKIQA